jgi:hypothetical protein
MLVVVLKSEKKQEDQGGCSDSYVRQMQTHESLFRINNTRVVHAPLFARCHDEVITRKPGFTPQFRR